MFWKKIKQGNLVVEIRILEVEKILNILCEQKILVYRVKRKNISTLILEINFGDYGRVVEIVKGHGGKIDVLRGSGRAFLLGRIKKQISLFIGAVIFILILFLLSKFVWAIDIKTTEVISPYEIRQELKSIGITPGILKKNIIVSDIEKKLESLDSDIMWIRVRVEGSVLKVNIEEKVNPPSQWEGSYGNLLSTKAGEITRIYTYGGKANVIVGDVVKAGDILIKGIDGKEGQEYYIKPRGSVYANVFYEKQMEVQISGTKLERSGKIDKDIYLSFFGKKIYLKKAIKGFVNYDKIEKSGKIFNQVLYYERVDTAVSLTEDEAVSDAVMKLEESLKNQLTRDAVVKDKIISETINGDNKLMVTVVFIVEENILNNTPVKY